MLLKNLLYSVSQSLPKNLGELDISLLTQDSKQARPGVLFFAIRGSSRDGHDYLAQVLENGASAAVVQRGHQHIKNVDPAKLIYVEDPRQILGEAAHRFYGDLSKKMMIVGVTGTNGKTTSTYLLEYLFQFWGKHPGVIGTVENRCGPFKLESTHTTPDAISLQKIFSEFHSRGADSVCMEVSSHALDQKRVAGCHFAAALFTNLTQDHLDYHSDMQDYFEAKSKLFLEYPVKVRAINTDDSYGKNLVALCKERNFETLSFGEQNAQVNFGDLQVTSGGIKGSLHVNHNSRIFKIPIHSNLIGRFNAANIAGAVAVVLGLGMPPEDIERAITSAPAVPGRMELVPNTKNVTVVVDYAHTPDALEKALKTLRELSPKKLICVFGCGGDRDPTKRGIMGALAENFSDQVIVTSDNPRSEEPSRIIDAIQSGMKHPEKAIRIEDRRQAIARAISILCPGDIVLIAGKGHEDYQIIGSKKLPFDDRKVALENL